MQIEKLRAILYEIDEVKKDLEELRFGCKWEMSDWRVFKYCASDDWLWLQENKILITFWDNRSVVELYADVKYKIIWNPLSLKHLMMYCDEKKIIFDINIFDWILTLCWMEDIFSKDIEYNIELELHEQEEETLVDIINFLKG